MILVLYPCLPALGVVIMRHVEPGAEQKKGGNLEIVRAIIRLLDMP